MKHNVYKHRKRAKLFSAVDFTAAVAASSSSFSCFAHIFSTRLCFCFISINAKHIIILLRPLNMRVLFMCVLRKKEPKRCSYSCVCGMWIHVHCASERTHDYANAVFRTGDYLGKFIRRKTKMEATLRRAEKNC